MKKNSVKRKNKSNNKVLIIILAVLFVNLCIAGIFAKYVYDTKKQQEMESSSFHISSNYLMEGDVVPEYQVVDWGSGFDINLYNYESENVALVSGTEIEYEVSVSSGWVYTVDNQTKTSYKMPVSSEKSAQVLHIAPQNTTSGGDVTVKVTTKSPYKKVLSATFTTTTQKAPEYEAKLQSDGTILVTIGTNNYSGTITVKWDASKFAPDNTNNLMSSWDEGNKSGDLSYGTFTARRNTTYQLMFFYDESSYSTTSGTGTTITLQ